MKESPIKKRQETEKKTLLELLKKVPIVQLACERSGVGRTTYYRWLKEDQQFRQEAEDALKDGEQMINDLSESQLITLIKEKSFPAVNLWLRQHHPKYGSKLEINAQVKSEDPMTPELEALVRQVINAERSEIKDNNGTQS